jgi:hypothetical protein
LPPPLALRPSLLPFAVWRAVSYVLLVPRPSERPISADFRRFPRSEGALLDLLAVGSAAQPGSTQQMRVVELKAVVGGIELHC